MTREEMLRQPERVEEFVPGGDDRDGLSHV